MSQFIPPSLAALNSTTNNTSHHNFNGSQNSASSEVKLKLKNAILQKLDRNKIAKSNSNINEKLHCAPPMNVTRSQNYLLDTQNQFKQSIQSMFHKSKLNNINENNVYNQQYLQFNDKERREQHQINPYQNITSIKTPMERQTLSKQIEMLNQLDENNLRRTTSEPNLKVKSALKDRLLEKRNLLNPFHAKRPPKNSQQQQQKQLPYSQQNQSSPLLISQNPQNFPGPSKASPASGMDFYQSKVNKQRPNEILMASQGDIGHSTPDLMSLHNQKQQLAVSALLSLSNSQNDLSEDERAQSLANTLRNLQQSSVQNNMNTSNSQHFFDSLAVASALNQAQNMKNQHMLELNRPEMVPSLSYPMLPNQLMMNAINMHKNQHSRKEMLLNHQQSRPKFGHAVHVEEENEMLLENELKTAAKLNDTHVNMMSGDRLSNESSNESNEEGDICELPHKSAPHVWNSRPLLVSTSTANIRQNPDHDLNRNQNYYTNQFYQHKLKDRSQINKMLLQQQQELEEHAHRQHQYQSKAQTSYFSDPYLLRSLEIASINSPPHINPNKQQKLTTSSPMHSQQDLTKQRPEQSNLFKGSSNQIIPMDYSLNQSEDRIYRYTTGIVYDTAMLKHECTCHNPSNHLETADRIKSIWAHFKARDLVDECELVTTKVASISDLLLTHNEQYALIFGSDIETRPKLPKEYLQIYMMNICLASCQGFALTYDQDNSWNEEHTPLACRVAIGSTYELARLVTAGKLKNGFSLVRPPGSHAEFNKPLGFCYFNTVALVAKMLKKNLLLDRILIVDWDVHHGNGTQQMTYNDPNILYISLHRHDNGNFFPGTGSINECGSDAGLGKNVNIAFNGKLSPPMSDAEYLAAFRTVVMPIAKAFKPQIVLVSCGFDGTENHPKELGGYKVSPMCFGYMTKKLMSVAEGKVVLALEGGYDKQSLCDCSEICLNALINKQIPAFPNKTLNAMPNSPAIEDLENIIDIQKQYWPSLNESKKYIRMSQNQFISVQTE